MTSNMLSILNVVSKAELNVKKININRLEFMEAEVELYNGPKILFSLRRGADNYLEVLRSLAQKRGFSNLGYIDLRVENRVYYQ